MSKSWTTPSDIAQYVRRRWDDGTFLRNYAQELTFPVMDIPIKAPRSSEIGSNLGAVREWIGALDNGRRGDRRYSLIWQQIGGRHIGRNEIPARALVDSYEQAWALLGVRGPVALFDEILGQVREHPGVLTWVVAHPLRALDLHSEMPRLIAAYSWLDTHRNSDVYLREISAPGVHTKFAELHRPVLAAMLGVPSGAAGFLAALGLRAKPDFVRLRPSPTLGLPTSLSELALRTAELSALEISPESAVVVENEISYLSVDVPRDGVVFWGKGFEVDRIGRLPWLADVDITYWGDLDTHGFAILDRLRAWLPQTRSVLMDRETLLAHRDHWGREDRPTRALISRLTGPESELYADLVGDSLGERIRLEQERISWGWVGRHL